MQGNREATGRYNLTNRTIVLLEGSDIRTESRTQDWYVLGLRKKYSKHIADGKIIEDIDNLSPSTAARIVLCKNANGRSYWVDDCNRVLTEVDRLVKEGTYNTKCDKAPEECQEREHSIKQETGYGIDNEEIETVIIESNNNGFKPMLYVAIDNNTKFITGFKVGYTDAEPLFW
jgi:hypothetical protein